MITIRRLLALVVFFVPFAATAGRPVFKTLTRSELAERSTLIFEGWPAPAKKAEGACPRETGRWWVHRVLKGDRSLKGKILSIADHGYAFLSPPPGSKGPSYAANRFGTGELDRAPKSSFLFVNPRKDGCYELAAAGAQVPGADALEMLGLFSEPNDCFAALRGFEFRADRMTKACAQDADCKPFFVHPDSCAKAYAWNRSAESLLDDDFRAIQSKARENCAANWKGRPACAPDTTPARCVGGKCELSFAPAELKSKLNRAVLTPSCAPHDAASVMISVQDGDREYPRFTVNWWGAGRPVLAEGGTFSLSGDAGKIEAGYQSSFCAVRGGCEPPSAIRLKVEWPKGAASGTLEFEVTPKTGAPVSGKLPLEAPKPEAPVICG